MRAQPIRTSRRLLLAILLAAAGPASARPAAPLAIGRGERLLVIAPHPDDETLGAGGLIQRVLAQGGEARVVLITAGDGFVEAVAHESGSPRPCPDAFVAYGALRLRESRAALRTLAADRARLQILAFPDGGLDQLLEAHWWRGRPERSRTTEATNPPYGDALEPDVPYDGDDLRRELAAIIRETRPTLVALPDPLDRHPDHRAAGLLTLLALNDWAAGRPPTEQPRLLAYLVHWPDWPPGWNAAAPVVRRDAPLDLPASFHRPGRRVALTLSDEEWRAAQAAMERYATQQDAMGVFLATFARRDEPFTLLDRDEMPHAAETIARRVGRRSLRP